MEGMKLESTPDTIQMLDSLACKRTFESIEELAEILIPIMHAVAAAIGKNCEVALHDLSSDDFQHTIYAIVNGTVTGRTVGGPSTNLGLEIMQDENASHDQYGYMARTADGRELHSSSVYFRNSSGKIIAAFCINMDLTPLQRAQTSISELLPDPQSHVTKEVIAPDIQTVLNEMITKAFEAIGKPPTMMSKADRIAAMRQLDTLGVFHVKHSVDIVARRMGVSRVTAYGYLDQAKTNA